MVISSNVFFQWLFWFRKGPETKKKKQHNRETVSEGDIKVKVHPGNYSEAKYYPIKDFTRYPRAPTQWGFLSEISSAIEHLMVLATTTITATTSKG